MEKAIFTFGRMNPPTKGHEKLINKIKMLARREKATAHVFLSHTQDKKKNPLDYADKIKYAKRAFGSIATGHKARTIIEVMQALEKMGYTDVIMVAGSDRTGDFKRLLKTYNGREYNFNSIEVISAGVRDPDAEDMSSSISASKMREYAINSDLENFTKGLPRALSNRALAKEIYNNVRKGLKISEEDILYIMKEIIK